MLRDIKRKHGITFLVILIITGFAFATRCLDTSKPKYKNVSQKDYMSSVEIKQNIYSDSVISRRKAILLIKQRKIKKFIPELMNLIVSPNYTSEDRRLSSQTIGLLCNINHIKRILNLSRRTRYEQFRYYFFLIISKYLDKNPAKTENLKSIKNFSYVVNLLKDKEASSNEKKVILEIIRKTRYKQAFDLVLAKFNHVELKTSAIITLPYLTIKRQKRYVMHKFKKILDTENNYIIRRAIKRSIYFLEKGKEPNENVIIDAISDLGTPAISIRNRALQLLANFDNEKLEPYIKDILNDYEKRVVLMALRLCAMKKFTGIEQEIEKAITVSFNYLRGHKDYEIAIDIANAGIFALGKLRSDKAYEIINRLRYHYRVKETAYIALSNFNKDEVQHFLEMGFYSEPEPIKSTIANIFLKNKQYDIFIKNLKSPNEIIRLISIKYAGKIQDENAKQALKSAFETEHTHSKWKKIYEKAFSGDL